MSTNTIGSPSHGRLIINADDWGRDPATTDRTLDCIAQDTISSVSAMVFMQDSERAAEIAQEHSLDVGLHLNLTAPFTAPGVSANLSQHQQAVSHFLTRSRYSQSVFHPGLIDSFQYLVSAQLEQFAHLYGRDTHRVDGHHHMHLCANVLLSHLLPPGTIVRRNFTFASGDKSFANRLYRRINDSLLARRHRMADFFFSLQPLMPRTRLESVFSKASESVVEVAAHPVNDDEHRLLADGEVSALLRGITISQRYSLDP